MSLKINLDRSPDRVSDKEYKILQDQGNLPANWPFRPELSGPPERVSINDAANTGTVNTANISTEDLKAELERRKALETIPTIGDKGGIQSDEGEEEEEGEEDYDDGWNNEQRRAELAGRELSIDGNKDEMIARLIRSDEDKLVEGDAAPAS